MQIIEILIAIVALGVLIFVHELGHFLVAKYFGVGVLEFAIGFGKRVWQKRVGDTTYSLRSIPLGGFVRMVGDDPREISGEKDEESDAEPLSEKDRALLADESKWFLKRPTYQKAAIVIAGPFFNLLFAFLVSVATFYAWGREIPLDQPVIGDVMPDFPAAKAGLKANDRVISIDGKPLSTWTELAKTVEASEGKEMIFSVERPQPDTSNTAPQKLEIPITGTADSSELDVLDDGPSRKRYRIGITVAANVEREPVGALEAVEYGAIHVWVLSRITVKGLWGIIQGAISAKHIGGPIMIFAEAAKSVNRGVEYLLSFCVFLSVSLAILNLLPVPVLDGGHLVFFAIEALKGSPVSPKAQERASQVGMLLLLLLSLFAVYNDVQRYFTGS